MTQTSNRLFDELARLMTDAANVAQGVKREAETVFRSQAERFVTDLDLVQREEFDVVREMASKAAAENEKLAEAGRRTRGRLRLAGSRGRLRRRRAKAKPAPRSTKPAEE